MLADLDYLAAPPNGWDSEDWCACFVCRSNKYLHGKSPQERRQFFEETVLELSLLMAAGQKYYGPRDLYELEGIYFAFNEALITMNRTNYGLRTTAPMGQQNQSNASEESPV